MSISSVNLLCKVGDPHVSIEPILLPCNFVSCLKCIEKQKDHFNRFHCAFCKSNHAIASIKICSSFEMNFKQNVIDLKACLVNKIEKLKGDLFILSYT